MKRTFLERIRASLGETSTADAPRVDDALFRLARADQDLGKLFTQEARRAGMQVYALAARELPAMLAALCREHGVKRVTTSIEVELNVARIDWRSASGLAAHYDADAGITGAECAFAETGSIVVASGATQSRGTWLVPPLHFCVLRRSQILPDMLDWHPESLPTSLTMITGPSKTADIEGILITGVHGPRAVHVLLLEDQ